MYILYLIVDCIPFWAIIFVNYYYIYVIFAEI